MCADVVIVGGGPVGCWFAIELKMRDPRLNVQVYERHSEYQRDHVMTIDTSSLKFYSKRTSDPRRVKLFGEIARANNKAKTSDVVSELGIDTRIRTLDFEKILKDHCRDLGVRFTYERIDSPEDAMQRHPEARFFVAADGAKSNMRSALFGEDCVRKTNLLASVDVKYETKERPQYLKQQTVGFPYVVVETVSKADAKKYTVALRFLVDQQMFDTFPEATFKAPLSMDDLHANDQLSAFARHVRDFQSLRAHFTHEARIDGTEKITKIMLSQYASEKFATMTSHDKHPKQKAAWFLIGDATMGMPFFRSINSGLLGASQLAGILPASWLPAEVKIGMHNHIVRRVRVTREFGTVAVKLAAVRRYIENIRPFLRDAEKIPGVPSALNGISHTVNAFNPQSRVM